MHDKTTSPTSRQRQVLDALVQEAAPLTAYALLDRLRGQGFGAPTQIYRALERLTELGLVHRLESLNAYVACRHPTQCRHGMTAFAICDGCGATTEFVDAALAHSLAHWAQGCGFALRASTVELRGRCAACQGMA